MTRAWGEHHAARTTLQLVGTGDRSRRVRLRAGPQALIGRPVATLARRGRFSLEIAHVEVAVRPGPRLDIPRHARARAEGLLPDGLVLEAARAHGLPPRAEVRVGRAQESIGAAGHGRRTSKVSEGPGICSGTAIYGDLRTYRTRAYAVGTGTGYILEPGTPRMRVHDICGLENRRFFTGSAEGKRLLVPSVEPPFAQSCTAGAPVPQLPRELK